MTTPKTTKTRASTEASQPAWTQEDLRAAHEIHTLVQMIYGQCAPAPPWATPVAPVGPHPPAAWTSAIGPAAPAWPPPFAWPW